MKGARIRHWEGVSRREYKGKPWGQYSSGSADGIIPIFASRRRKSGCAPTVESFWMHQPIMQTGIIPRHKPHHLSLLPSGPDEVRDRLLRGVRSKWPDISGLGPSGGNSAPHKADFGYRAPLAPHLAQPETKIPHICFFASKM